jgi:hypothetical protein
MTGIYHSVDEFEKMYFPERNKNLNQQRQQIEPQKFGNTLAIELLTLLKK